MEKISSLIETLAEIALTHDHLTGLQFVSGDSFAWDYQASRISYSAEDPHAISYLLHEFGHAVLNHQEYMRDIDLIKMEREAWEQASALGSELHSTIDQELIEDALDSYRDWLHSRSLCPSCSHTGIQTSRREYQCIACRESWRVNEARTCALRRYTTKKRS
jgi:hypothetical protein